MPTPSEKIIECLDIFTNSCFDKNEIPKACDIHDYYQKNGETTHNCLGCNFAESSIQIRNFLLKSKDLAVIEQDFTIYILLLYLLVERIEIVFGIIDLPEPYRENHFKVFQKIRKWANFIKHPKSFILTHHPTYDFENSGMEHSKVFTETINDTFVDLYYKGFIDANDNKAKNKELYKRLTNKTNILVTFPDIAVLTKNFCYSYSKFIDTICKNEIYIEVLSSETSVSNYFENT